MFVAGITLLQAASSWVDRMHELHSMRRARTRQRYKRVARRMLSREAIIMTQQLALSSVQRVAAMNCL